MQLKCYQCRVAIPTSLFNIKSYLLLHINFEEVLQISYSFKIQ